MCRTLPFFLTNFFLPFQVFLFLLMNGEEASRIIIVTSEKGTHNKLDVLASQKPLSVKRMHGCTICENGAPAAPYSQSLNKHAVLVDIGFYEAKVLFIMYCRLDVPTIFWRPHHCLYPSFFSLCHNIHILESSFAI